MNTEELFKCTGCDTEKPATDYGYRTHSFYKHKIRRSRCKPCECAYARRERAKKPWVSTYGKLKNRAKQKGVPFDLTKSWLRDKFERGCCELTGLPTSQGIKSFDPYSPSIDRIIPERGYTQDNCRLILWCLNAGFNSWGEDAFRDIARAYLEKNP